MKRLLIGLLSILAGLCNAAQAGGLTGSQINDVIRFEDRSGFMFQRWTDLNEISDGKPILTRVMIFTRVTDNGVAVFAPSECQTERDAVNQLNGSKLLNEFLSQIQAPQQQPQTPKTIY